MLSISMGHLIESLMMKDLARREWLPILFRRLRYIYIFRCRILFATYRIGKFNDIGNIRKRTIPRFKNLLNIYIYIWCHTIPVNFLVP